MQFLDYNGLSYFKGKLDNHFAKPDGSYESMSVGNAEQLVSSVGIVDKVPYLFRTSGGSADIGNRETDKIVGGTVCWNQLITDPTFEDSSKWTGVTGDSYATFSFTNNILTMTTHQANSSNGIGNNSSSVPALAGHKVLFSVFVKPSTNCKVRFGSSSSASGNYNLVSFAATASVWNHVQKIGLVASGNTTTRMLLYLDTAANLSVNDTVQVKNFIAIDLTQMFGSTIADYIYSLETANAGAGVAWFKKLFPKPYYAYNAGELLSVSGLQSHDMVGFNAFDLSTGKAKVVGGQQYEVVGTYTSLSLDGETITPVSGKFTPSVSGELTVVGGASDTCIHLVWDGERDGEYEDYKKWSYPLDSSLTLRGIPKLDANNDLYYDGDTYESDGTVTRKYAELIADGSFNVYNVALQSTSGLYYTTVKNNIGAPASNPNPISDRFIGSMGVAIGNCYTTSNGALLIAVLPDQTATTIALATEWFAQHPTKFVYELATPTTETADPYQIPQNVDDFGTEEYVTNSIVPVGHETFYQANLKAKLEMAPNSPDGDGDYIVRQTNGLNSYVPLTEAKELPDLPTTDGTYVLKATVSSGTATLSWVADS